MTDSKTTTGADADTPSETESADYKSTVFLPKTDFPMKAGLPKLEPALLARWYGMDLYKRLREDAKDREKFVLHDGPPYANGHLHIGHALNKILKDVIVRAQQMMGFDANYVPGWDCHGLPIEWKIEEGYRKQGKNKDEVPVLEFRQECREFAAHWVEIQKEEFKRLGVIGDWDNPYLTMSNAAEAAIVREVGKFVENGGLYKGSKPVLWSVVEKTALADAEVEYADHTSTTVWVRFPVVSSPIEALTGQAVVIWTTTPWTLPGNRAIAFGADIDYAVVEIIETADESLAFVGERFAVAEALLAEVLNKAGVTGHTVVSHHKGQEFAGTVCRHCLREDGFDFEVPLHAGSFVTTEQGTGFVHIAPGHGEDDFLLGKDVGLGVPDTVNGDGLYYDTVPRFAGKHVFKVNPDVVDALKERGRLLAEGKLEHSYPHSWRSKAPLIFRNTPQWFISMDTNDLRENALKAIDDTQWVPSRGRNRIHAMVESRPDWCVSRQRQWGVPITVFVSKKTGEVLRDPAVTERIARAVEEESSDAWLSSDPARFLGNEYDVEEWEPVQDIVEVWFDSGCTHAFVLEQRGDLQSPADLYLEGSDQHRGWFHTSLLESCGTRGRAPYKAVLTHGFVLDEKGRKESKSLGNVTDPQKIMDQSGADILRLWVVASDYTQDLSVGPNILKQMSDLYRRLRNTFRYLLGNLTDFDETERLDISEMPELERWVLHRLWQMDKRIREACKTYDFHGLFNELHHFCAIELSAFYFDMRKDVVYCDSFNSLRRRAARTVLDTLYDCLVKWLAPFICFTAEEVWLARNPSDDGSIHLQQFPDVPEAWRDDALAEKWSHVRRLRRAVTGALEKERAAKTIGSSLQAHPVVTAPADLIAACADLDMADVCITSDVTLQEGVPTADMFTLEDVPEVGVVVNTADGEKCARCWKVLPDVGAQTHPGVCGRCSDAVDAMADVA
ncbi:MAG: isoleucine--tRNA ligase [Rhodospirillaceae bacterium]|jgi:isoleucyl-tRNA synthetase|nr:isoleucine--tRNA ligase [Rhodospirillaceae bacterium]